MIKRILLKLSGEQFAGKGQFGIDSIFLSDLAQELKALVSKSKVQVVIVVGGGNFLRGASLAKSNLMIERVTADYMGMLATLMNGMALVDILEKTGQPARLQTKLKCDSVAEPYIRRKAIRHLEKGRIVIVSGGTGNPFVTTDTAAVTAASELDCEIVLKATKVDGVYNKDPRKHRDAKKFEQISYIEAIKSTDIKIMDNAALSLAMDNSLPIRVFDLLGKGNIAKIVAGKKVGTLIS